MSRYAVLVVGLLVGCDLRSPSIDEAPRPVRTARAQEVVERAPAPEVSAEEAKPEARPAPDASLGAGFEMRTAVRDGRLALVPIVATGSVDKTDYLTLPEGMARGLVSVRELPDGWIVSSVQVRNSSSRPLLALQGEVILDGQQDRVLAESAVILAGETQEISVRCVEAERGDGAPRFRSAGAFAELALRRVVAHQDQSQVWEQVDQINRRYGLSPETRTYRGAVALQARGEAAARRDRLTALLAAHPDRAQMVGVAVVVDGKVLAVDRFANPALYRRIEPRLLASYAVGEESEPREGRRVTPDDVRALTRIPRALATTDASYVALRPPSEPPPLDE
jgi:hypothetical protein